MVFALLPVYHEPVQQCVFEYSAKLKGTSQSVRYSEEINEWRSQLLCKYTLLRFYVFDNPALYVHLNTLKVVSLKEVITQLYEKKSNTS